MSDVDYCGAACASGAVPNSPLGPAASDSMMRQLTVAYFEENRNTGMDVETIDTLNSRTLARD